MSTDLASLPDDPAALKAMIVARDAELLAREQALAVERQRVTTLEDQLSERTFEIEHLKLLIAKLKKQQYGRSSEKLDRQIEQLELKLEELQIDEGVSALQAPRTRSARANGGRKPLPEHLDREDVVASTYHDPLSVRPVEATVRAAHGILGCPARHSQTCGRSRADSAVSR